LRGLAALYVVLHHAYPHKHLVGGFNVYNFFRFGQEAVILFFLLSGFVIKFSFSKSSQGGFRHYFLKRFTRLYLPLVCVFLIGYLLVSYADGSFVSPNFSQLFGNLFMLQDWAKAKPNVIVDPYLGNDPLWSLAYEWWFYMLFYPITVFIKNETNRNRLVFTVSIVFAGIYVVQPLFPVRIVMYFAIWWAGVVMAEAYLKNESFDFRALLLPMISLGTIVLVLTIDVYLARLGGDRITLGLHPLLERRHFAFALFAMVFALIWRASQWVLFDTLIKPFALFAPISYTIYILHWYVMIDGNFLDGFFGPITTWFAYFGILVALSYLIEVVLYPRLRKPVMQHLSARKSARKLP
jgi:peptidoglycan/LPS O-acetylase OafA/YrhL